MARPLDLGTRALEHKETGIIPRAELWLGSEIFEEYDLDDSIEGHVKLRKMLGMDLLFLPISRRDRTVQFESYRYFDLEELNKASKISEIPVSVIIDGPFQGLTEKKGLMNVFSQWIKNRDSIENEFLQEVNRSLSLITDALELKPDITVIADDIAYEKGIYISNVDLDRLFKPFYLQAVNLIHAAGSYALYHSCGDLTKIIPNIISYGFDGLAACQDSSMDMRVLKKDHCNRLTFLTGIDTKLLQTGLINKAGEKHFMKYIKALASGGGFILCSSSGLYSKEFLDTFSVLYELSERINV